jgi:hypothetical protein
MHSRKPNAAYIIRRDIWCNNMWHPNYANRWHYSYILGKVRIAVRIQFTKLQVRMQDVQVSMQDVQIKKHDVTLESKI